MFEEIENLLSENDLYFLENKCKNFHTSDTPHKSDDNTNSHNFYVRDMVNIKKNLIEFQVKIENYLFEKLKIKYKTNGIWINKVTNKTNQSDDYHLDESDFTIITYLNDDFVGGEFVYLDSNNETISVKPKKNMCILQNNKLFHKINPVSSGVRYSCVTFLNYVAKDIKTLV